MPDASPRVSSKPTGLALLVVLVAVLVLAVVAYGGPLERHHGRRIVGYGQIRYAGAGPERWAQRFRQERAKVDALRAQLARQRAAVARELRAERRVLLSRPNVVEALNLAAATYGNGSTLWRKAVCESHLDPRAKNRKSKAGGLLQFLPSTWRSTPYGRFSVYSPYANALAAGWMHANGRGGEWVCR